MAPASQSHTSIEAMHRLSWNVAWPVSAGAAVLLGAAWLAGAAPFWLLPGAAAGLGALAYVLARRLLRDRLDAAHASMQRLGRFEFASVAARDDAALEHAESPPSPEETDRREPGDELDALLGETRRAARALGEKMEELRKMENYRREFIGNVSHELKTPIFSVQGFAETLLSGGALEDESVRRSFVEKIKRNADRLDHLARDLAEIARIETGELEMTVTPFELRPLVREVVESLEPVAAQNDVALHERLPADLPCVEGDRERLRQVLTNLVGNAIKYNEPGGQAEVAAREVPSGAVKTYVVDDGIGVAPEHVERLTERFYRVDRSRSRRQGGTGLGLAIVKHILGAHGSELTVSSSPGHGSTFGFTLATAAASGKERQRSASPRAGEEQAKAEHSPDASSPNERARGEASAPPLEQAAG